MLFRSVKTIFFDYDGCLHNSIKIYAPAFKKAYAYLVAKGLAEHKAWQDEEISYWLGFNSHDMWKAFTPHLDEDVRNLCSELIGEEMKQLVEQGKAELYPGALEVLPYLKNKGYRLVFISNCRIYYKDCHNKLFHLDNYFEELVCSEEYDFIPKYEMLGKIKSRYPGEMAIVGDRKQDIESGKRNKIYTIGCRYGFCSEGELDEADVTVDSILELKGIFL